MAKASPFLLVLISLGFFLATYNLVTAVIHNQRREPSRELIKERSQDPVVQMPAKLKRSMGTRQAFHVALTATDAPYSKWQCRIMYYWYKKMKDRKGSEMGGFTRVLHSGSADDLMEEIPTFVVEPLPDGMDQVRVLMFPEFVCSIGGGVF